MKLHFHHHKSSLTHSTVSVRGSLLVVLVAVLAAIAIYTSTDTNTAFGLLTQPAYADFVPVEITFRTSALVSEPFLELQLVNRNKPTTQVVADLFDATNPPPVTDLAALNTRIGGEIMVYWVFPQGVTTANVYRTDTTAGEEEVQIATTVAAAEYLDSDVKNGDTYTYRVVSTVVDGDVVSESEADSPTAVATPADTIPPQAPTDVRVTQVDADSTKALRIEWANPLETDFASVMIYRSTHFGTRGEKVATVQAADSTEYVDTDAPKNTTVYYTVVAYDEAGNGSSDDFQMPLAGNPSPFSPIGVTP